LETGSVRIAAAAVDVDWRPRALLSAPRRLALDRLTVTDLTVVNDTSAAETVQDSTPPSSDSSGVTLPFPIEFDRVEVVGGTVMVPGTVRVDDIQIVLTGSATEYRADGTARVEGPSVPRARIRLAGTGSLQTFEVESVRAEVLEGTVDVAGTFTWLPAIEWNVTVEGEGMAYGELIGDADAWPGRMNVRAETAGGLANYRLEATVNGTGPRLPPSDVHLVGQGSLAGFEFEQAWADVLGGRATVAGALSWDPDVVWDVAVALDNVSPGPLLPDSTEWPGSVTLHGRSQGRLVDGEPRLAVVVDSLYGELRNLPLDGHVVGAVNGN